MKNLNQKVKVTGEITAKFHDQKTLTEKQKIENKNLVAKCDKMVEEYKFTKFDSYVNKFRKFFNRRLKKTKLEFMLAVRDYMFNNYHFGKLVNVDVHKNVICNAGFNALTRLLTGDTTYTGEINKALFGTGTTGSASASDTTLETETYRNDIASATASSNIAYLTAFLTEAEYPPSGSVTITEFGNAIDGTGTVDTGQLWSYLKGLSWAKDTSTAIVVSCKYTFASV
ncbi:MAG: hypothetical protein EOL88_00505 [Bacteroidia bacterium]|nr:hypothetical protein [Bacteroidia bacterium]